ncbi:FAD-dependent oxidoreductase [Thalassobacillus sp. CUG 92003]|uniref:FAD-dependent oxidoreductase n=1 Tax=Thalassobacillus sp. CUG 92003 TaxID=2736641 RepID=UPI0015E65816|nr:FAD-dependent oxidoreductase [Thalassobacillus sp. CUG 92003]
MAILQDVFSIFKKRDLPFVERNQEEEGVYTFLFEKVNDMTWKAGQHGLFTITHQKIKDHTRPFTIASAPSENAVQITMKINDAPSEFKKTMLEFREGDTIKMAGPVGSFHLKENNPIILIAGGIGITPFRSILKQIEAEGIRQENPIHLLYNDSSESYVFREELEHIANNNSVSIDYIETRNQLLQEIDKHTSLHGNNGKYLIAGPKSMVKDTSAYLQTKKISKQNIKKDVLIGY